MLSSLLSVFFFSIFPHPPFPSLQILPVSTPSSSLTHSDTVTHISPHTLRHCAYHRPLSTQAHISFHNNSSAPRALALPHLSFPHSVSRIVAQITEALHWAGALICHCVKRAKLSQRKDLSQSRVNLGLFFCFSLFFVHPFVVKRL